MEREGGERPTHLQPLPQERGSQQEGGACFEKTPQSSLIQTTNLEIPVYLLLTGHLATESNFTTKNPKHCESYPHNSGVSVWVWVRRGGGVHQRQQMEGKGENEIRTERPYLV